MTTPPTVLHGTEKLREHLQGPQPKVMDDKGPTTTQGIGSSTTTVSAATPARTILVDVAGNRLPPPAKKGICRTIWDNTIGRLINFVLYCFGRR